MLRTNKLHHKVLYQTCAIRYKLVLLSRSARRRKIRHNKILSCKTTEKSRKSCKIRPISTEERHKVHLSLPQFGNFSGNKAQRKVTYPNFASSAKVQVTRKSRLLSFLHHFHYFNDLVPRSK